MVKQTTEELRREAIRGNSSLILHFSTTTQGHYPPNTLISNYILFSYQQHILAHKRCTFRKALKHQLVAKNYELFGVPA
jgi:hypothetical protein